LTLDTLLFKISAASSNTIDIGVYSESLIGTLVNYPSFPALIVNFTVTINPCIITSLVKISNSISTTPILITIFNSAYVAALAQYVQTPACGYLPNITLDSDTFPTSTFYSPKEFWTYLNSSNG